MKILRSVAAIVLLIITSIGAAAQGESPVTWRMSVRMTSATEGVVTIKAVVEPGWHLYGTSLPENGPKPTEFIMDQCSGITFTGKLTARRAPLTVEDPMFGMKLTWWDSDIAFTRQFRVTDPDNAVVAAQVTYMCCNDSQCRPATTVNLKRKIPAAK